MIKSAKCSDFIEIEISAQNFAIVNAGEPCFHTGLQTSEVRGRGDNPTVVWTPTVCFQICLLLFQPAIHLCSPSSVMYGCSYVLEKHSYYQISKQTVDKLVFRTYQITHF